MELNEQYIFTVIFALVWILFMLDITLNVRQRRVILKYTQVPIQFTTIFSQKSYDKARAYALDKNTYGLIHKTYVFLLSMVIMFWGVMPYLWKLSNHIIKRFGFETGEMSQGAIFLLLLNALNTISLLPFSIYRHFVLEEKHGFNKLVCDLSWSTAVFYVWDKIKQHFFQSFVLVMILNTLAYIIKVSGDYFFFYAWLFVFIITLGIYTIYPDFIAPFFDNYTPLPEGTLKMEIEKIAETVGIPLYQIAVIENSVRSAHSNAFVFGAFTRKKIVLFDTLIKEYQREEALKSDEHEWDKENESEIDESKKGCDLMEVLAVVCHELGHWKMSHIPKRMVLMQINIVIILFLFTHFYQYRGLYEAFGFYHGPPVLIALIIVIHFVLLPYFGLFSYLMNVFNRNQEFEADRYAKNLGRGTFLKCALIKMNLDNKGFPVFDRYFSAWNNSHPPLLERLQYLEKDD